MNKLKTKVIGTAFTAALLTLGTTSANAAETSTEQAVSQFVLVQGKQLMSNVSQQLKQSIAQSIESFSIDQAISWVSEDDSSQLANKEKAKNTTVKAEEE